MTLRFPIELTEKFSGKINLDKKASNHLWASEAAGKEPEKRGDFAGRRDLSLKCSRTIFTGYETWRMRAGSKPFQDNKR